MDLATLKQIIANGESGRLELEWSTAELRRAGEALGAFLDDEGGQVVIGVGPGGKIDGQQVSDNTMREVAAVLGRFEPPARIELARVDVGERRSAIVPGAPSTREHAPIISRGRPCRRVRSTTTG